MITCDNIKQTGKYVVLPSPGWPGRSKIKIRVIANFDEGNIDSSTYLSGYFGSKSNKI